MSQPSSELFQTLSNSKETRSKTQKLPPNHRQAANVLLGTNLPKKPSPVQQKANQSRRIALGAATGVFLTQSRLQVCERAPISTKKGSQKRVPGPKNPEQGLIESWSKALQGRAGGGGRSGEQMDVRAGLGTKACDRWVRREVESREKEEDEDQDRIGWPGGDRAQPVMCRSPCPFAFLSKCPSARLGWITSTTPWMNGGYFSSRFVR